MKTMKRFYRLFKTYCPTAVDKLMLLLSAALTWCLISLGPVASMFTTSLVMHVAVQFPLLIAIGWVLGVQAGNTARYKRLNILLNRNGLPGIFFATFVLAFWMIPRWIDLSLGSTVIELTKCVSLTVLIGVPLGFSWKRLHPVAVAVVKIELLTMLFRLGWIYMVSPDRLCNNYLIGEQYVLGQVFICAGFLIGLVWLVPLFAGNYKVSLAESLHADNQ